MAVTGPEEQFETNPAPAERTSRLGRRSGASWPAPVLAPLVVGGAILAAAALAVFVAPADQLLTALIAAAILLAALRLDATLIAAGGLLGVIVYLAAGIALSAAWPALVIGALVVAAAAGLAMLLARRPAPLPPAVPRPAARARLAEREGEPVRSSEARVRQALGNLPLLVFYQDRQLRYTWARGPHAGFDPATLPGKTDQELFPSHEARALHELKRAVLAGEPRRQDVWLTIAGERRCFDLALQPLLGPGDEVQGLSGVLSDITERKLAEGQERRRARRQSALAGLALAALAGGDELGRRAVATVAAELGTGLVGLFALQGAEALLTAGVGWAEGLPGQARAPLAGTLLGQVLEAGEPLARGELLPGDLDRLPLLRDAGWRALLAAPVQTGEQPAALVLAGSPTPREWSRQEAAFLTAVTHILASASRAPVPAHAALYDPLTHLPNRALLLDHLARALARAARREALTGVVVLSLAAGAGEADDALIGAAVERLRRALRPSDLLARTGPAEFALIVEDAGQAAAVVQIAERLVAVAEQAGPRGRAHAGVALGAAGRPAEELLERAGQARDWALSPGAPPVALDDPSLGAASLDEQQRVVDLRRALAAGALELRYEPVLAAGGALVALEAHIGWPAHGELDARALWTLAAQAELDDALMVWTLTWASRDLLGWPGLPTSTARLIVPAAPRLLAEPPAVEQVAGLLAAAGLAPDRLLLAVDEGALGDDRVLERLGALRQLGIGLLLDGFGLGRLAPARLAGLGAAVYRLDRSLTAEPLDASVVGGLARLSHGLGAQVAALEVDSDEGCRQLRAAGCDLIQGRAVAAPLTAAQLAAAPARFGPAS